MATCCSLPTRAKGMTAMGASLRKRIPEFRSSGRRHVRRAVMINPKIIKLFQVTPGEKVRLKQRDTGWAQTADLKELGKDVVKGRAETILTENLKQLTEAQELLYANDVYSVLLILQAMDAAGKDGTIKHVMSGVNPQGCQVFSFKKPSDEELNHNFLWRYMQALPER